MRLLFFSALIWLGFSALAMAQDNPQMKIGGATIDVALDSGIPADLRKLILDWIATAARAVTTYYTKFPVPQVSIAVQLEDGKRASTRGARLVGNTPIFRFQWAERQPLRDLRTTGQ